MTATRLRLLYLQPAPLFGGAERQAAEQASYLPDLGIDVTVMAGPGQAIIDWLSASHATVVRSDHFPGGGRPRKGLARLTLPGHYVRLGLRARAQILQILSRTPVDAILASLPFAWITGSVVAREVGVPIAWRAGGHYLNPAQVAGLWSLTRFMRPDLLICNGKAVERRFHPLIPAPVEIVPNGVDVGAFNPSVGDPARYRPAGARCVIGFAGRLATSKRPQDVIGLAALLRRSQPDARVLIAGEGTRRPEYERLARQSGADNVTFLGYVGDMPSFYAACDIIVLPSSSEGSSNMLLEAMACRKPVVASDIPPLREQLAASPGGLVYPLGDVPALTRAVERLIAEPTLRQELAERGCQAAWRSTARDSAVRLASILRRLVDEYAATRGRGRAASRSAPAIAPVSASPWPQGGSLDRRIHAANRPGSR